MTKLLFRYAAHRKGDWKGITGNTLQSVERIGPQMIIDYKLKRVCMDGRYPGSKKFWSVADITIINGKPVTFGELLSEVGKWIS